MTSNAGGGSHLSAEERTAMAIATMPQAPKTLKVTVSRPPPLAADVNVVKKGQGLR